MNFSRPQKRITAILLWMYFLLVFSIYPAVIPYRSVITTFVIFAAFFSMSYFKLSFKNTTFIKCLVFILVFDTVSAIYIGNTIITHVGYSLHYILLILTISDYCKLKGDYLSICKIIFWPSFIGGPIIGLYQMITGRYVFEALDSNSMLIGTIISDVRHENANYAAISMLFCAILALYLYKKVKKEIYHFAVWISIICVLLTFSRTTIAVLLLGIFIYFLNKCINRKMSFIIEKRTIAILIILMVISIYLCNIFMEQYLSSAEIDLVLRYKTGSTSALRTNQWIASIQVILNNGIGHFLFGFSEEAPTVMGKITGYNMTSHNFIFGRAAENGIIAFLSAIVLYFSFFINTIKNWKRLKDKDEVVIILGACGILLCYLMISIIGWELIIILTISNLVFNETHLE